MARETIAKRVCNEVINMYLNDVINGYGTESFEGWCEDGDVFIDDCDPQTMNECIVLMHKIAPFVDALTDKMVNED